MTSPSDVPTSAPGKVILNAHLVAAPGQAERLQAHLATIQKHSLSDAEPGCLEYRTARSFVTDGAIKFTVWEVYAGVEALTAHSQLPIVQALLAEAKADLLAAPPLVEFYHEF